MTKAARSGTSERGSGGGCSSRSSVRNLAPSKCIMSSAGSGAGRSASDPMAPGFERAHRTEALEWRKEAAGERTWTRGWDSGGCHGPYQSGAGAAPRRARDHAPAPPTARRRSAAPAARGRPHPPRVR
eukprot:scaffold32709_cov51-Phaeocystis_antarctica.AAC.1